jgi:hypothetical protein
MRRIIAIAIALLAVSFPTGALAYFTAIATGSGTVAVPVGNWAPGDASGPHAARTTVPAAIRATRV